MCACWCILVQGPPGGTTQPLGSPSKAPSTGADVDGDIVPVDAVPVSLMVGWSDAGVRYGTFGATESEGQFLVIVLRPNPSSAAPLPLKPASPQAAAASLLYSVLQLAAAVHRDVPDAPAAAAGPLAVAAVTAAGPRCCQAAVAVPALVGRVLCLWHAAAMQRQLHLTRLLLLAGTLLPPHCYQPDPDGSEGFSGSSVAGGDGDAGGIGDSGSQADAASAPPPPPPGGAPPWGPLRAVQL